LFRHPRPSASRAAPARTRARRSPSARAGARPTIMSGVSLPKPPQLIEGARSTRASRSPRTVERRGAQQGLHGSSALAARRLIGAGRIGSDRFPSAPVAVAAAGSRRRRRRGGGRGRGRSRGFRLASLGPRHRDQLRRAADFELTFSREVVVIVRWGHRTGLSASTAGLAEWWFGLIVDRHGSARVAGSGDPNRKEHEHVIDLRGLASKSSAWLRRCCR